MTRTAYHFQNSGQVEERMKSTAAQQRHYRAQHQDNWSIYVQPLAKAHNTQVHISSGLLSFILVLARHARGAAKIYPPSAVPLKLSCNVCSSIFCSHLLVRLAFLRAEIDSRMIVMLKRNKNIHDERVQKKRTFEMSEYSIVDMLPLLMNR